MDKDLYEDVSKSDDSADELTEDEQIAHAIYLAEKLATQQQHLKEAVERLQQELDWSHKALAHLEDGSMQSKLSELQSPLSGSPTPARSTISQSQNLSEDKSGNSPDSMISARNLNELESVADNLLEAIRKQSTVISNIRESFEPLFEDQKNVPVEESLPKNSPPKSSEDEIKVVESDTDTEIMEVTVKSIGKGKEAANPHFRYKKRSKPESSSTDSAAKGTPVKCPKEPFGTPQSKPVDSKSPKTGKSELSSIEKHSDHKRALDKSCARILDNLKSSGNPSSDDSKVHKIRKIEDTKKPSKECPALASILSNKNYESIDISSCMDPERAARFQQSDESTPTSGSENVVPSEEERSLTSVSDVSPSEKDESSLASISEDESSKS